MWAHERSRDGGTRRPGLGLASGPHVAPRGLTRRQVSKVGRNRDRAAACRAQPVLLSRQRRNAVRGVVARIVHSGRYRVLCIMPAGSSSAARAVVVAADKMTTSPTALVPIEAETALSKIVEVDTRVVVAISGSAARGHLFADEIAGALRGDDGSIRSDATRGSLRRQLWRLATIENGTGGLRGAGHDRR